MVRRRDKKEYLDSGELAKRGASDKKAWAAYLRYIDIKNNGGMPVAWHSESGGYCVRDEFRMPPRESEK